jgi:hypothetical protein
VIRTIRTLQFSIGNFQSPRRGRIAYQQLKIAKCEMHSVRPLSPGGWSRPCELASGIDSRGVVAGEAAGGGFGELDAVAVGVGDGGGAAVGPVGGRLERGAAGAQAGLDGGVDGRDEEAEGEAARRGAGGGGSSSGDVQGIWAPGSSAVSANSGPGIRACARADAWPAIRKRETPRPIDG